MRKPIVVSTLIICLLFIKCSVNPSIEEAFNKKTVLDGEEVFVENGFFAQPKSIEIIDTIMLIVDEYQGKFFTAIDLKNNKLVNRFGYKGRGPNELDRVHDALYWKDKRIVSFKISNPTRYWYLNIDDITEPEVLFHEILNFKFERSLATFFHFVPIRGENEKYIGTGKFHGGMYGIFSSDGKMDTIIGNYTVAKENESVDCFTLGSGYQGKVKSHPELPLVAYISYRHDLVEVVDCTTDNYNIKKFHGGSFPELRLDGQRMRLNLDTSHGFLDLSVTQKYIYGLFYGIKEGDAYDGTARFSNLVYVFDWNLSPVICYELDHNLRTLKASEDDKTLYSFALNDDNEMHLMQWQMKH